VPRPLALLLALLLPGCARRVPTPDDRARADGDRPVVVLVAFDGMRADYLDRQPLPSFARVAAAGVRARALIPSFPSKTFPNHYTMATGLVPGRHGIVANVFWDPRRRATFAIRDTAVKNDGTWYGGEPIWVTAERQGVRAAAAAYPGAEGAIGGVRPTAWLHYDETVHESTYVDSVAAWLRRPPATRPHLVALYVDDLDAAGHRHGPDAPQTDSAVAAADRLLGRLLDSLDASPVARRVNVVIVSDHGMARVPREQVVDIGAMADLRGVRVADPGPVLLLWFDGDPSAGSGQALRRRERTRAALARALDSARVPARVWRREDTPPRWGVRGQPRAGDLLVVAEEGWVVTPRPVRDPSVGQHGWDPASSPAMRGVFLAAGPNVVPLGTIAAFENVHVYPFLARLLGLRPAQGIDGDPRVLERLFRK
jgi:hypothetical protein